MPNLSYADITGHKKAETALRMVNTLTTQLYGVMDVDAIVKRTVKTIVGLNDSLQVALYLHDSDNGCLRLVEHHGFNAEAVRKGTSLPLKSSLAGLTGLPNRTFLQLECERLKQHMVDSQQRVALILFDIDGFKEINDTLGHHMGDQLLISVSQRVTAADSHELLRCADVAMYYAKHTHTRFAEYDPAYDEHSPERLSLMADLRQAVRDNQLVLHYQPKVGLHENCVSGFEALVRWQQSTIGLACTRCVYQFCRAGRPANLGLKVVAEGAEDRATYDTLRGMGCDFVQGFYISKPLDGTQVEERLKNGGFTIPNGR